MIEQTENRISYVVGDSGTVFAFPIRFFEPGNIQVYLESDTGSVQLERGSDFEVEQKNDYTSGANITLHTGTANVPVLPVGKELTILRIIPAVQEISLTEYGRLPSKPLETQLDKIVMICQQLEERLSRALVKLPGDIEIDSPEDVVIAANEAKSAAYYARTKAISAEDTAREAAETAEDAESYARQAYSTANQTKNLVYELPVAGSILAVVGSVNTVFSPPNGCLYCDGSEVGREQYAELFSVIGELFGGGDGETTFNIPDLRGKFLRGYMNGTTEPVGTAQEEGLPEIHGSFHAVQGDNNATGAFHIVTGQSNFDVGGGVDTYSSYIGFDASDSSSIYGNSEHVTPENMAVYYFIKYRSSF